MQYAPPHAVTDQAKLAAMVTSVVVGHDLPPIVVCGVTALTGSHRIAAYEEARKAGIDRDVPTVELSEIDYKRACLSVECNTLDETGDYNVACAAILAVTSDDAVKAALADQTHGERLHRRFAKLAEQYAAMSDAEIELVWSGRQS